MGVVILLIVIAVIIFVLLRRHQHRKPAVTANARYDAGISDDARYVDAGDIDPRSRTTNVPNQEQTGKQLFELPKKLRHELNTIAVQSKEHSLV